MRKSVLVRRLRRHGRRSTTSDEECCEAVTWTCETSCDDLYGRSDVTAANVAIDATGEGAVTGEIAVDSTDCLMR